MGNGKTGSAMQIETLEEYVVLAKHLNFSKAAIELSMTQSTLSKHMQHSRGRSASPSWSAPAP